MDVSITSIRRVAAANSIRVREIPGVRGVRYRRADIMAMLARLEARENAAAAKSTVKPRKEAALAAP
jgi:hypothetical protein